MYTANNISIYVNDNISLYINQQVTINTCRVSMKSHSNQPQNDSDLFDSLLLKTISNITSLLSNPSFRCQYIQQHKSSNHLTFYL